MGPPPAVAAVRRAVRLRAAVTSGRGDLVLVACSGGADSLALAARDRVRGPPAGLRAGGVSVDHGLQPGSAERAAAVVADHGSGSASTRSRPSRSSWTGPAGPRRRPARPVVAPWSRPPTRHGAGAVLLGHTRDDQAETVLLGLARGSGARSLAGMAAVAGPLPAAAARPRPRDGPGGRRGRAGCSPWDDPHNADPAYRRSPGPPPRCCRCWRTSSARASPRRWPAPPTCCAPTPTRSTVAARARADGTSAVITTRGAAEAASDAGRRGAGRAARRRTTSRAARCRDRRRRPGHRPVRHARARAGPAGHRLARSRAAAPARACGGLARAVGGSASPRSGAAALGRTWPGGRHRRQ